MKKITDGTLARTLILILALLNQIFAVFGIGTIDIEEDSVYQVISVLFTIGAAIVAWWKNNSFTQAAIAADELKDVLNSSADNAEIKTAEAETDSNE
ncbi:MAG: phage holin [Eubacterium sp.]